MSILLNYGSRTQTGMLNAFLDEAQCVLISLEDILYIPLYIISFFNLNLQMGGIECMYYILKNLLLKEKINKKGLQIVVDYRGKKNLMVFIIIRF